MSRNIFHFFNVFVNKYKNLYEYNYVYVPLIGTLTSCHIAYVITSEKTNNIYVKGKYIFTQNGHTNFMIIDNNDVHYNINNSFWYWKWDSIEDWSKIKINKQLDIKYYGYRIPELGVFPNIVLTNDSYSNQIIIDSKTINCLHIQ